MNKNEFKSFMDGEKLVFNTWYSFSDMLYIKMKNEMEITPSISSLRFLISKSYKIYMLYGDSEPFGGLLENNFGISTTYDDISYDEKSSVVVDSKYGRTFRTPQVGDVVIPKKDKSFSQAIVTKVSVYGNVFKISLSNPITFDKDLEIGFYDPMSQFDRLMDINGDGVYLHFIPNRKTKNSKFGIYHKKISIRNIELIKNIHGIEYSRKGGK